jgi:hypothetical protein
MVDELAYRPPVIADTYPPYQNPNLIGNLAFVGAFGVNDKLSFFEFLAARGVLITKQNSAVTTGPTSMTVYTVPAKKVFYLTACTMGLTCLSAAGAGNSVLVFYPRVGNMIFLRSGVGNQERTQTIPFPIPLRLVEGEYLVIAAAGVDIFADCSIFGYEIDA